MADIDAEFISRNHNSLASPFLSRVIIRTELASESA